MFAPSAPYGAVDILVDNAGIYPSAAIEEMTSAEWAEVFAVNVDATFVCLQAAARSMAQRSQGAIVNVASLSALRPAVRQSHYNSSKAAVIALTRSAAVELAPPQAAACHPQASPRALDPALGSRAGADRDRSSGRSGGRS